MSHNEQTLQGPEYWTTLSEYHRDEEYLAQMGEEFYPGAKPERYFEGESSSLSPMQRRTFLKLSAFATVAAALQGCERPVDHILPYVNKPADSDINHALYYASTCTSCAAACGLLVKTRTGRPIKLEGNPDHPMNQGKLCTRGQASITDLYDPDRQKFPMGRDRNGALTRTDTLRMADYDQKLGLKIANAKGKVVLLTPTLSGPSNQRLIELFKSQGSNFEHVIYDAMASAQQYDAHRAAFGRPVTPAYHFDKADVVVCIGGDPLAQSVSKVSTQMGFAAKRRPTPEGMSRVYAFEPAPTLTGMASDYRHMVRPEFLLAVGLAIANELVLKLRAVPGAEDSTIASMLSAYEASAVASQAGIKADDITRAAKSLADAKGRSIVYTDSTASRTEQGTALAMVGVLLNSLLGNYGPVIDVTTSPSLQAQGDPSAILRLIEDLKNGAVSVLIMSGVNPAYSLPKAVGFSDAVKSMRDAGGFVASFNLRLDETSDLSDVLIPQVHGLESWGDAEPMSGLLSIQQPTINPIFGKDSATPYFETRAWQESLMAALSAAGKTVFAQSTTDAAGVVTARLQTWQEFVKETWMTMFLTSEEAWTSVLQLGVLDQRPKDEAAKATMSATAIGTLAASVTALSASATGAAAHSLVLAATNVHGDGQSMSNPMLIELPDPISKISWDNHASVSPELAKEKGLKDGDVISLNLGDLGHLKVPVFVQPGTHKDVVAVQLGWGRNTFDGIGDGIGVNAWAASTVAANKVQLSGIAIKEISKTKEHIRLANTQGHNYLYSPKLGLMVNKRKGEVPAGATVTETGEAVYERPIIGETTWNEWALNKYAGYPNHEDPGKNPESMWERSHKYVGHHWGMAIDLNACNGCGACIMACQIENNVPIVGKDEVIKGREMFWIRIDRYYRGTPENPDFVLQALLCQHCDNAPCETVCPVIATMHNDEGLNVMTYNRCVGTRYCANNCPYKVRRFNFWQYTDYRTGPYDNVKRVSPMELVLNPEVSVRSKGVMEKCSFCSHRIKVAKEKARESGQPLQDGAMVTACQQTCPAKAIVFGDRNDPNSEISKLWRDPRAYGLLVDLNTDPSIRYMTLVRNRDEKSPYRTKYQAHREDHHGADHGDHGHDEKEHSASGSHEATHSAGSGSNH
ncbi:4Fe-4S dicluster domain-containing protein [bacterium]|nr:4Fe-4S dicluster domain-containing protein [bacterium]